uniref:SFRICE_001008 n=1 Tax=Spodoptera frugiperda TaxID=7108 RepID=A0A2H1UZQ4_SPOFR
MSTISNGSLESLGERVYLEKATDRLIAMLYPDPSIYYTHNPAILLWAFTSQRISHCVRLHVLSQWFKSEDSLPADLTTQPIVWELLLNILIQCNDKTIVGNCMEALHVCLEDGDDDSRQDFAGLIWSMLPNVLSKVLIDTEYQIDTNICHFLDLATTLPPLEIDQIGCLKTAVLITAIFSKNLPENCEESTKHHYEYVCLKLGLYLLSLANSQNDNRVLLTYTNRVGFLQSVLAAADSTNENVACAALQLLSYPKSVLQIQTHLIIKTLKRDSTSERGASLLQLVYMVLNTGASSPLALAYSVEEQPTVNMQCNALRALMLRIQLMLCCRDSKNQSTAGWKTLSSIFKHAIVTKNDTKLIATLTSQPWTHTLIQFQLTQDLTPEFLTFTQNWLTLLKITIKKCQEMNKMQLCKQSLVIKTMVLMKKNLVIEGALKEMSEKVLVIVDDILEDAKVKY